MCVIRVSKIRLEFDFGKYFRRTVYRNMVVVGVFLVVFPFLVGSSSSSYLFFFSLFDSGSNIF